MHEWSMTGGLGWGGFVYEHVSGAVAHMHYDNGDVRIAASDLVADQHELPDLDALEQTVDDDLRVLRETEAQAELLEAKVERLLEAGVTDDDPRVVACRGDAIAYRNNRALLLVSGLGDYATFQDHRGRPGEWTPERLVALAHGFVEIGDRWMPGHEEWAREQGLGRRAVHKRMTQAAEAGIVRIAKSGSANVYELTGFDPPNRRARADWHRDSWRSATASRDALHDAIASSRVRPLETDGRQRRRDSSTPA